MDVSVEWPRKLRHYSVIPFLLSLSAYSELTEIKTFTGINLAQSLHVCKPWCKRMLVWYPLARLHGLKQKYFQHCDITNCPAPRIEIIPNRDTTVSYRTEPWILWTVTPLIYIYIYIKIFFFFFFFFFFKFHPLYHLEQKLHTSPLFFPFGNLYVYSTRCEVRLYMLTLNVCLYDFF